MQTVHFQTEKTIDELRRSPYHQGVRLRPGIYTQSGHVFRRPFANLGIFPEPGDCGFSALPKPGGFMMPEGCKPSSRTARNDQESQGTSRQRFHGST